MKINKSNENTKSAGFSLVENMVAVLIMAIMLTALYGCFASGYATVRTSRESLRATQILLSKLEAVRLSTFAQLSNPTYNPLTFVEFFDPKDQAAGGGGTVYSGAFTPGVPVVGSLPESYRTNMILVTVTVNWTSGHMNHTRSMQTYSARDGIAGYVSVGR